jgi:hypothetical protein
MTLDHVHEIWYGNPTEFNQYCTNRGYIVPEGDVTDALVRASQYIDSIYGSSFIGYRTHGREQPRAWPRVSAYDTEGYYIDPEETPVEVRQATYESALRELQSPGSLQPDIIPGKIKESVTVGSVSVTYATSGTVQSQLPVMTVLNGLLAPLLGGNDGGWASSLVGRSERTA